MQPMSGMLAACWSQVSYSAVLVGTVAGDVVSRQAMHLAHLFGHLTVRVRRCHPFLRGRVRCPPLVSPWCLCLILVLVCFAAVTWPQSTVGRPCASALALPSAVSHRLPHRLPPALQYAKQRAGGAGAECRGAMRGEAPPMSNAVRLPLFLADPFCRLRRYVFIALLLAEGMLPGHVRVYHGPPAWTVVDATSLPLDFELLCGASWAFAQVADGPCEWVPSGPSVPRVEALHAPGASGRCPCTQGVGPGWVQGISTAMGLRRMYL